MPPDFLNSKLIIDTLREDHRQAVEYWKTVGDRMTILLGLTATGFGLLIKLTDKPITGCSMWLLIGAVTGLLLCFVISALALFPKQSHHPSETDLDFLLEHYVYEQPSWTQATVMSDLCHCVRKRRAECALLSFWFRIQIITAGITMLCVVMSEMISAG